VSGPFGFGIKVFFNQRFNPVITDLARRVTSRQVTDAIEPQLVKA